MSLFILKSTNFETVQFICKLALSRANIGSQPVILLVNTNKELEAETWILREFIDHKKYESLKFVVAPDDKSFARFKHARFLIKLLKEHRGKKVFLSFHQDDDLLLEKFIVAKMASDYYTICHSAVYTTDVSYLSHGISKSLFLSAKTNFYFSDAVWDIVADKYDVHKAIHKKLANTDDSKPDAVDQKKLMQLKRFIQLRKNDRVILYHGAFIKSRDIAGLLRLLSQLLKKNPDYKLLLSGKGQDKDLLFSIATALQIAGRVYFVATRFDLSTQFALSELFIMPSLFEEYPAQITLALNANLPTIVPDLKSYKDLLDRQTGVISYTKSVSGLASKISELFDNPEKLEELKEQTTRFGVLD